MDLGLGAVSLTFQVFSGCVKGYQLLSEAKDMPNEYKYMRIQLKQEQYRLLDWGSVAGVAEYDDALGISSSDKGVLHDVLEQKKQLLSSFGKYEKRYRKIEWLKEQLITEVTDEGNADEVDSPTAIGLLPAPARADTDLQSRFPQEGEILLKKCLGWTKKSRTYPRRLRWASFDKAKFERLLLKLASLNDWLRELLNTQQLACLVARTERTDRHIIQLNNKVDQLVEIFRAGQAWSTLRSSHDGAGASAPSNLLHWRAKKLLQYSSSLDDFQSTQEENSNGEMAEQACGQGIARLARFKVLEQTIGTEDLTDERAKYLNLGDTVQQVTNVELSPERIQFDSGFDDDENRRTGATLDGKRVWIEWKAYEPQVFDGKPDLKIVERIVALVVLLKDNSLSRQFRAPRCLGYFRDIDPATEEDHCRFGIVFEQPGKVSRYTKPVNLLELLRATEVNKVEKPSLTERVKLAKVVAEALEKLHAVNWLHKGLRSENILFFHDALQPEDLELDGSVEGEPIAFEFDSSITYLSGFDYSRPAQNEDLTEKPPEDAAYDLYRHPLVQGSKGSVDDAGHFQKEFDVYALGVVLLEIIYWQPIDHILDIELRKARPSTTLRVRSRLLDERKFLSSVKANAGVMLEGVVRACLNGPEPFVAGADESNDDKETSQAAKLQIWFNKHVVDRLSEVKV